MKRKKSTAEKQGEPTIAWKSMAATMPAWAYVPGLHEKMKREAEREANRVEYTPESVANGVGSPRFRSREGPVGKALRERAVKARLAAQMDNVVAPKEMAKTSSRRNSRPHTSETERSNGTENLPPLGRRSPSNSKHGGGGATFFEEAIRHSDMSPEYQQLLHATGRKQNFDQPGKLAFVTKSIKKTCMVAPEDRTDDELEAMSRLLSRDLAPVFFAKFRNPLSRRALCRVMQHSVFQRGDVIFQQGDVGEHFYIVLSGRVSVTIDASRAASLDGGPPTPGKANLGGGLNGTSSGAQGAPAIAGMAALLRMDDGPVKDARVGRLKRGDTFGEIALLASVKRTATCTALEQVDLLSLHKDDFLTVYNNVYQAELANTVEFLGKLRFFQGVPREQLVTCAPHFHQEYYKQGHTWYLDEENHVHFLMKGNIAMVMKTPKRRNHTAPHAQRAHDLYGDDASMEPPPKDMITPIGKNAIFGASTLFPDQLRGWVAVAQSDCTVLSCERTAFLTNVDPPIVSRIEDETRFKTKYFDSVVQGYLDRQALRSAKARDNFYSPRSSGATGDGASTLDDTGLPAIERRERAGRVDDDRTIGRKENDIHRTDTRRAPPVPGRITEIIRSELNGEIPTFTRTKRPITISKGPGFLTAR